MEFFPRRSSLYRNRLVAVTLAATTWLGSSPALAQELTPQYGRKAAVDKGPRAVGLVQISPKGKARFTPIVIMIDGNYYDAGSYKAAPVPMALDFGIVYEAFRAGVSQGIFTITQPGQLNHVWIAEGTWTPAGENVPGKHKKYAPPVIADEDNSGPPVLHRHAGSGSDSSDSKTTKDDKDTNTNTNKDQAKPATPATAPATSTPAPASTTTTPGTATTNPPPAAPTTTASAPAPAKAPAPAETAKTSAPADDEQIADPNRPRLRRGKPDPSAHQEPFTTFDASTEAKPGPAPAATGTPAANAKGPATAAPPVIVIPAISDVGGPDPRPYTYDLKPVEEAIYRNKMLDLATAQLRAQTAAAAKASATPKKTVPAKTAGKSPSADKSKPVFDDVNLRIFDLSSSNEPVLVLSAKTHPAAADGAQSSDEPKEITLIARTNLEGEVQKLFFSQTDSQHLDISPRMELIDAVDVDGDGRGELLFRRTFDDGSAYAIYRVTPDRLWPLFEGTP
jgi:hypothetical protein